MSTLTHLKRNVRRRVEVDGDYYELMLDSEAKEILVRKLFSRTEFRVPIAALIENKDNPLFAQESIRARGKRVRRTERRATRGDAVNG